MVHVVQDQGTCGTSDITLFGVCFVVCVFVCVWFWSTVRAVMVGAATCDGSWMIFVDSSTWPIHLLGDSYTTGFNSVVAA